MAPIKNVFAALALISCASPAPFAATIMEWVTVETTATVWAPPSTATSYGNSPLNVAAAIINSSQSPSFTYPAPPPPTLHPTTSSAFVQQPSAAPPNSLTVSTSAPARQPTANATPTPAAEAQAKSASKGSLCEGSANACFGDVTHYDGGRGACGWNVNSASDMSIALPHGLMGLQSNGNPYCGRSLSIKASNGSMVNATVGDKCMGCEGHSIDLTDVLFLAVVPNGNGRVAGIEWWFD